MTRPRRYVEPGCSGACISSEDLGVSEVGFQIAYPHPECPAHGQPEPAEQTDVAPPGAS